MFGRILFPTDFSAYANCVFACLPELKTAGMREVVLMGIIRPADVPLPETINRKSMERVRWSVEEKLHVSRMALEGQGVRVITRIDYGNPAAQIVKAAKEEQVSLIAIGAQGKTAAQELLLGSVAYEVVRHAPVPVLIQKFRVVRELGHTKCERVCERMFTHILHPTDFSACADEAFRVVKRLKAAGTERVTLLHVQDERVMKHRPSEQLVEFDRQDTERLEALRRALLIFGLEADIELRHGLPFRETLQLADAINPTLIVLGSYGRSAVREMLTGSTFDNVLRLSQRPVLVVRCTG